MIVLAKITALFILVPIAIGIGFLGKKRQIGFYWAFYFGLLNPIIALLITRFSKKESTTIYKTNGFIKVLPILGIIYGILLLYGAITTPIDSEPIQSNNNNNNIEFQGDISSGDVEQDFYLNEATRSIGTGLGGGILSLVYKTSTYTANDNTAKRYFRFYAGILLISLGSFFSRNRKSSIFIKDIEDNKEDKYGSAIVSPLKELYNKSYFKYTVISIFIGTFLGWHFRVPNSKLLAILYNNYVSGEKKDLAIQLYKNHAYFSTEYFSLNWAVFLICSVLCFAFILFFFDKTIRMILYKKLSFTEERKEING